MVTKDTTYNEAEIIRKMWLSRMGLTSQEISENIIIDPPININEEYKQLAAMLEIETINEGLATTN